MTDTEKLELIKAYVEQMSPIFRIALYLGPEDQARNEGYDLAMHEAQQDLLKILEDR